MWGKPEKYVPYKKASSNESERLSRSVSRRKSKKSRSSYRRSHHRYSRSHERSHRHRRKSRSRSRSRKRRKERDRERRRKIEKERERERQKVDKEREHRKEKERERKRHTEKDYERKNRKKRKDNENEIKEKGKSKSDNKKSVRKRLHSVSRSPSESAPEIKILDDLNSKTNLEELEGEKPSINSLSSNLNSRLQILIEKHVDIEKRNVDPLVSLMIILKTRCSDHLENGINDKFFTEKLQKMSTELDSTVESYPKKSQSIAEVQTTSYNLDNQITAFPADSQSVEIFSKDQSDTNIRKDSSPPAIIDNILIRRYEIDQKKHCFYSNETGIQEEIISPNQKWVDHSAILVCILGNKSYNANIIRSMIKNFQRCRIIENGYVILNFSNEELCFSGMKSLKVMIDNKEECFEKAIDWVNAVDGLYVRYLTNSDPESGTYIPDDGDNIVECIDLSSIVDEECKNDDNQSNLCSPSEKAKINDDGDME